MQLANTTISMMHYAKTPDGKTVKEMEKEKAVHPCTRLI